MATNEDDLPQVLAVGDPPNVACCIAGASLPYITTMDVIDNLEPCPEDT